MTRTSSLLVGGAISGAIWFLIAITFDKGVRDFNVPVIPTASPLEVALGLVSAAIAGIAVAFAFSRAWGTRSRVVLFLIPFGALALGVLAFSVLAWVLGQVVGSATESLAVVVGTLFFYAMLSVFTPILYLLALANGLAIRKLVRRAA
jgi:hypothetical protein